MSNAILRSYQVFGADDQVLTSAVEAVQQAVKDAKSKGSVQKVTLTRKGHRHDIEVGDVFVVPASVCNDAADFPTILLDANLRQHATGEGMVEFQMGALADPKELSKETLQAFKKVCFKDTRGDVAPLIVFAASWAHPSAYQSFAYEEDNLLPMLREVAYASPFNPSLSSAFDQLKAVDPDSAAYARIVPVTQHIFSMPKSKDPVYPTFAKGLEVAEPEGGKKASASRPTIRLRRMAADLPEVSGEDLSGEEMNLFQSLESELGAMVKTTDPKQASTYVDPMPLQGEMGLRAQPDYGAPDSKEQVTPAMVDGPDPKKASEEEPQIGVTGLVPETSMEVPAEAPEEVKENGAMVVKEAATLPPMTYILRNAHDNRVWAAQSVDGVIFGGEWTTDRTAAYRFASLQTMQDEVRRNMLGKEAKVEPKFCKCEGDCECSKDAAARLAKLAGWWSPGGVCEQFYPELLHQQVDSPFISQSESPNLINPFGAPGKQDAQDTSGLGLGMGIENTSGIPLRQEMNFYGPEYARNFYGPRDNMSPGSLKLKQHPKDAALANPSMTLTLNYKAQSESRPVDEETMARVLVTCAQRALGTGEKATAAAMRANRKLLSGEAAKIGPFTFTLTKIASSKQANPALLALPAVAEAAAPAIAEAAGAAEAGAAGAAEAGAAAGEGMSVGDALAMVPPPADDESNKQASSKQAAPALALFQGLEVASPEEHPQARFDETAPAGEPGAYVEPVKEDAVPQDEAFVSMDAFLKGLIAAYAAQLIGAFKVTGRPLALATPYTDTLDLMAALEFAGTMTSEEAIASAKAQFSQALGNLNDDQRKMLLDNAVAQAAVWCQNTQGSGGFTYEVFVRAEKLDATSLTVKVVTGTKGGK